MNNVPSVNPPGVEFLTRDNLLHLLDCVPYLLFAFFHLLYTYPRFGWVADFSGYVYIGRFLYVTIAVICRVFLLGLGGRGRGSSGGPVWKNFQATDLAILLENVSSRKALFSLPHCNFTSFFSLAVFERGDAKGAGRRRGDQEHGQQGVWQEVRDHSHELQELRDHSLWA